MDREISFRDLDLIKDELDRVIRIQDPETRKRQLVTALLSMVKKEYHDVTAIAYGYFHTNKELARIIRIVTIRLRITEAIYRFSRIDQDFVDLSKNIEQMYTEEFIEDNKTDGVTVEEIENIWLSISKRDSTKTFLLIKNKISEINKIRNGLLYA